MNNYELGWVDRSKNPNPNHNYIKIYFKRRYVAYYLNDFGLGMQNTIFILYVVMLCALAAPIILHIIMYDWIPFYNCATIN